MVVKFSLWTMCQTGYVYNFAFQFVLGFSIVIHTPVSYGDYEYPGWAIGVGWIFALASIVPVPILAIIGYNQVQGCSVISVSVFFIYSSTC